MKVFQTLSIAFFMALLFSSCLKKIILNKMGVFDNEANMKKVSNLEKEMIYIPMHHIGKKSFYLDVKKSVDSLRSQGYIFYYEGVRHFRDSNALKNDTIRKKIRKIIGLDVLATKSKGGYIDTFLNTMLGKKTKLIAKYQLVNQPGLAGLGLDSMKDVWADTYASDLVEAFEKRFGTIILSRCDDSNGYDSKYSCQKYKNKEGKKFMLEGYRNNIISNQILQDPHKKIAIVYGGKHFKGVIENLQQQDSNWRVISD